MHLPLVKCYWCENCQSVIDSAKTCEGCGSSLSIVALSIWMDSGGMAQALEPARVESIVTDVMHSSSDRKLHLMRERVQARMVHYVWNKYVLPILLEREP